MEQPQGAKQRIANAFKDPAFATLVLVNGVLIALYRTNINQASTIVLTYYLQSVVIGISHFIRMAALKDFDPKDFAVNGSPIQNNPKAKWSSALFFAFHFGFFHFVYFIFLIPMLTDIPGRVDLTILGASVFALVASSVFETRGHIIADREKPPVMALLFFAPYLRVVPMHIFIIMAFKQFEPEQFLYFLLLKALADLLGYFILSRRHKHLPGPINM